MADTYKELTDLIVDNMLRPGAPRFDESRLQDVRLKNNVATFYLDTGALDIPIDDLTMEEARIAYDFCTGDEGKQQEDKGFMDYLSYRYNPPSYVIKYRAYFALAMILIVLCIAIPVFLNSVPVNNDKNEAIAIAMNDASLKSAMTMTDDVKVQTLSCVYIDPATDTILKDRGRYMQVTVQAWVYPHGVWSGNFTGDSLFSVYNFYINVDLENKSIIKTEESQAA